MANSTELVHWSPGDTFPALATGELHVWQIPLDRSEKDRSLLFGYLSNDERARAARFHFNVHREQFIVGRGILRTILGGYLNLEPGKLTFAYGMRGKPGLPDQALRFNLAHSGGLGVLALTRHGELGIDIEQLRPMENWVGVMSSFFSIAEQEAIRSLPDELGLSAFFTCWTRKEAYVKAIGAGIGVPLDRFNVSVVPGSEPRLLHVEGNEAESSRWHFQNLPLPAGYIGVVAHEGKVDAVRQFQC
jgi:4'-phosphopantetheinyl transferase